MGRNAFPVSNAQVVEIRMMALAGRSTQQMAVKLNLPEGVVNWQMEKHNIRTNHSRMGGIKTYRPKSNEQDYSMLPDNVLFDYKKFPLV